MEFNHDLLKNDLDAVFGFIGRFFQSFMRSDKKVGDRKIGMFEELYIRFRLHLVDMGPVKWFKTIVVIIGGIILYTTLFRHSDPIFMIITVILFIIFYAWVWGEELEKESKDGKSGFDSHFATISKSVLSIFPKKEEKKK